MTYGSLFSGIGGIDLGLDRASFECRWQCEIEEFPRRVLEKHWTEVPKYGDIRQLTGRELEPVDLICGGYPCQPFSQAGKRAGENDPRHLWPEFARIILVLRPRYVLLENVPGHLSLGFGAVLGDLAGLGYDAEWTCLRASDFGAAHLRKRVFVVAYLQQAAGERCDEHAGGEPQAGCETVADSPRAGLEKRTGQQGDNGAQFQTTERDCGALPAFAPGPADPRWADILRKRPDLAPALKSSIRGVAHEFPDWLDRTMKDRTKRLKALGNAVVPACAEWVGRRILEVEKKRQ